MNLPLFGEERMAFQKIDRNVLLLMQIAIWNAENFYNKKNIQKANNDALGRYVGATIP